MTRENFLHEVIIRLSDPDYINKYAKQRQSNWNCQYNHMVVVDVIEMLTYSIMHKQISVGKIIRKVNKYSIDRFVLFLYGEIYKKMIGKRFDL